MFWSAISCAMIRKSLSFEVAQQTLYSTAYSAVTSFPSCKENRELRVVFPRHHEHCARAGKIKRPGHQAVYRVLYIIQEKAPRARCKSKAGFLETKKLLDVTVAKMEKDWKTWSEAAIIKYYNIIDFQFSRAKCIG